MLLPRGHLPLNIFEPRYLAMIDDALAGDRLIGMIQWRAGEQDEVVPDLYPTGCVGRLTAFSEADGERYLITLYGLCRFDIAREIESRHGYRRVAPDWSRYRQDTEPAGRSDVGRERLLDTLRRYLAERKIKIDWKVLEIMDDEQLVTTLAMNGPFKPSEKQALLVAEETGARSRAMIALLEMSIHPAFGADDARP